jgi:NADH:ubiquinone oxidoreductase subunit K
MFFEYNTALIIFFSNTAFFYWFYAYGLSITFLGIISLFFVYKELFRFLLIFEIIYLGLICIFLNTYVIFSHSESLIYVLLLLSNSAAEAAIGLSLLISAYRIKKSLNLTLYYNLRG